MRRTPFWRVKDFARYMALTHWRAKALLLRYNAELSGLLLCRSSGTNRMFGFYWASLAKHAPDAFVDDPLELQGRIDVLEDRIDGVSQGHRLIVSQTHQNTRDISRLRARRKKVA